jgi:hypothetical protein
MVVRSFGSADRGLPGAHQAAGAESDAALLRHSLRPRLAAIAPSVVEAVRFAGGWLFDQVMAGWDVTVLTSGDADARPAQILGARVADLEMVLARRVRGSCLQGIAVRADLCGSDARVRRMVDEAREGLAEIRLWGEGWPAELNGAAGPVRYQLSVAARAFKAQALAAAAIPADFAQDTEEFRSTVRRPSLVLTP